MRSGRLTFDGRGMQVELPADGGIISSVKDLAKWEIALYSQKLVKRSILEQMWTPGRLNDGSLNEGQGLGWGVGDYRGHRTIGHAGSSGADFLSFPDDKLTVIMLCNLPFDDWAERYSLYRDICKGVAGQFNRALLPPPLLTPQPDSHPGTTQQLLSFLSDIASGKESSLATPRLHRQIIEAAEEIKSLRDYAQTVKIDLPYLTKMVPLTAKLKDLTSFTFLACDKVENRGIKQMGSLVDRICYFKLVTTKKTFYYTFWLTADGLIADFDPKE